jgi:hypothetical protein
MQQLPGTDIPVDHKSPLLGGDAGVLFWVVVGVAAAFMVYLLVDGLINRWRQRELREKGKRAAERQSTIDAGE